MPRRTTSRTRRNRTLKRLFVLTTLCILTGILLQYAMAPEPLPDAPFDLEHELQAIPENQRAAVREKWQSLSETDRQQAQRTIQRLSESDKQKAIDQLKARKK